MKYVFAILLFALSVPSRAQQNFDTVKIQPIKITDNLYMLKGSGGNIGVLTGKDGTLMVDDQFAPLSNKINGAIKTLDPGEIRFLINTHVHGDHSGGNDNFKRMGVTVVAQRNVRKRMSTPAVDNQGKPIPLRDKDALPVITFDDRLSFHLNDEDIELIHFDPAHTDGDVAVHFRNANVYHLGDMYVQYGYPFIDVGRGGGINGFITSLDKILVLLDDNSKIIPGHGELATKADVKIFRDRLVDIRDQVAAAQKKGKKNGEITAMDIASKYDADWSKGFVKGKDFILLVAENLRPEVPAKK